MMLQLCLTLAFAQTPAAAVPQGEADTLPQDPGTYGTQRPQLGDVRVRDMPAHTDAGGRAAHQLIDLAGSRERGFAAIWRDGRDGNSGLYFGRLDAAGEPLEPERALYPEGSAWRELEPAIALSPRGNGAFVWYSSGTAMQQLKLRSFDAAGVLTAQAGLLGSQSSRAGGRPSAFGEGAAGESRRPAGIRLPAIALGENGGAVAWGESGTLWIQRLGATSEAQGEPEALSTPETALAGPLRACAGRATPGAAIDAIGCAWTVRDGVVFAQLGLRERRSLGAGILERLVAAPGDAPGWWALVETAAGHRLIPVPSAESPGLPLDQRGIDLGVSAREACDVAARGETFLVSVHRAGGAVELFTLDPRAKEPRPLKLADLDAADSLVGDLRIACAGERALVAWTGSRSRQTDVFSRTLSEKGAFGAAKRWNTDEFSSQQRAGRIASRGGYRAVIAWLDSRAGETLVMARWIAADGKFLSDEIFVTQPFLSSGIEPPAPAAGEPSDPCVALGTDGGFLVAWKQLEKRGYRLLGQKFDARGKPMSERFEFDAGIESPPTFKADLDAACFGNGYAVAFGRKDAGVFVRALESGDALAAPVQAGEHPLCQNVSLVELEGGNLAVAWDITVPGAGNKAVRARLFSQDLEPRGAAIEPPLTEFGDDWDPSLAPTAGGGFALAFVGGQQHNRDVFVRRFDAAGAVVGPLIPISTRMNEQDFPSLIRLEDGSLCVGFEDDLSAYDHTYVRRVAPGAAGGSAVALGDCRTLNEREAVLNESRNYPRLAPLAGGGFAAVWVESRRSRGTDVYVKILGPKFDK